MKIIKDFNDATSPLDAVIKPRHALHCKRKSPRKCVQARAINSIPGVKSSMVFKYFTYVHFEKDPLPTRYQNSAEATYFAELNDKGGRKAIIDEIRDEIKANGAIKVRFNVPRPAASKAHLRSAKMKEMRRESAFKHKHKLVRRAYKLPSKDGMRSGTGIAHSWIDSE